MVSDAERQPGLAGRARPVSVPVSIGVLADSGRAVWV